MSYIFSDPWVKKANNSIRKSDLTKGMAHCIICEVDFSIASQGYKAIELHMQTNTHMLIDKLKKQNLHLNDRNQQLSKSTGTGQKNIAAALSDGSSTSQSTTPAVPVQVQSQPAPQKSEDLTEEIHKMRAEIEALTTQKDQTIADRDEVIRKFDELQQEHAQVQEDLKKKSALLEIAADLNNPKGNLKSTLAEEESAMKKEIEELKKKLDQLEVQLREEALKVHELEKAKNTAQSKVCAIEKDLDLERKNQEENLKSIKELRQEKHSLQEQLKSSRSQGNMDDQKKIRDRYRAIDGENATLKKEISEVKHESAKWRQAAEASVITIRDFNEKHQQEILELTKTQEQLQRDKENFQKRCKELENALEIRQKTAATQPDASTEMDSLQEQIKELNNKREILQYEFDLFKKDTEKIIQSYEMEKSELKQKLQSAEQEISHLKKKLQEEAVRASDLLEREKNSTQSKVCEMKKQFDLESKQQEDKLHNVQEICKRLEEEKQTLDEELQSARQQISPNSNDDSNETVNWLITKIQEFLPEPVCEDADSIEENDSSWELVTSDSSLDQLGKEIHQLIKLCANRQLDLNRKIEEMKTLKKTFMKQYEQKPAPKNSADMDEHTMKVMLTALDGCLHTHFASSERVDLQSVMNEVTQIMNKQENIARKLGEKINSLKLELEKLKTARDEFQRQMMIAQLENSTLKKSWDLKERQLTAQLSEWENKVGELEKENAKCKESERILKIENNKLKYTNSNLCKRLKQEKNEEELLQDLPKDEPPAATEAAEPEFSIVGDIPQAVLDFLNN